MKVKCRAVCQAVSRLFIAGQYFLVVLNQIINPDNCSNQEHRQRRPLIYIKGFFGFITNAACCQGKIILSD